MKPLKFQNRSSGILIFYSNTSCRWIFKVTKIVTHLTKIVTEVTKIVTKMTKIVI